MDGPPDTASAKEQEANAATQPPIVPPFQSKSEKAILAEDAIQPPLTYPRAPEFRRKKLVKGRYTWLMAAFALPTVGICLLLTLYLVTEPTHTSRKFGRAQALANQEIKKNIFVLDINASNYPSKSKLERLKSTIEKNRNSEIYHITLNRHIDQPKNITGFENLKKNYSNFHFLFQSAPSYFHGSLFEGTIDIKQLLFKAQLLILWRYGGMVISPDWSALKPLNKFLANDDRTMLVGGYNGKVGFISTANPCNAKLFDIMLEVKNLKTDKLSSMDVIDRVLLKSEKGLKKLGFPEMCNNNTRNDECVLMRGDRVNFYRCPKIIRKIPNPTTNIPEQNKDWTSFFTPKFVRRYLIYG